MNGSDRKAYVADLLKTTGEQYAAGHAQEHDALAGAKPAVGVEHVVDYPGDEPLPGGWTPERIAADPDAYFDAHAAEFQKRNPGQTLEQIRSEWKYASNLMGYAPLPRD